MASRMGIIQIFDSFAMRSRSGSNVTRNFCKISEQEQGSANFPAKSRDKMETKIEYQPVKPQCLITKGGKDTEANTLRQRDYCIVPV